MFRKEKKILKAICDTLLCSESKIQHALTIRSGVTWWIKEGTMLKKKIVE